jgi:hypothetical protein
LQFFDLHTLIICLVLTIFSACKNSESKDVIAEYKGSQLLKSEIPSELFDEKNSGDSSARLKQFVEKWIENQIIVQAAEETLSEEEKNKEKLINDYRNSLLVFEYHQKMAQNQMDTSVSEQEIQNYFNDNLGNYLLRKNIVKIKYLKISKTVADVNKIKKLIQNSSKENDALLLKYAEDKADNFYLDSNWLFLDDITKEIPLNENYNQQRFLANNKYIQLEENNILYILYIIDFKIKNSVSPIEFEKEKIKDILLYQRKLKYLKDLEKNLIKNAKEKGDIKYYY